MTARAVSGAVGLVLAVALAVLAARFLGDALQLDAPPPVPAPSVTSIRDVPGGPGGPGPTRPPRHRAHPTTRSTP